MHLISIFVGTVAEYPSDLFLFVVSGGMKAIKRIFSPVVSTLQKFWLKPLLLPPVLLTPGSWYQV